MSEIDANKERWFDVKRAAIEARVSDQTIYNAIKHGELAASQVPAHGAGQYKYRISESSLLDWILEKEKAKEEKHKVIKSASDLSIEDIAKELTIRLQKAYSDGFKDGQKTAKKELKGVLAEAFK